GDDDESQEDFSSSKFLDVTTRKQCEKRLLALEKSATDAFEMGDNRKGVKAQKEYDEINSYLKRALDNRGRSRTFSGENEKARISVTKAITRAYEKIRPQAPKTAEYLAFCI